MATNKMYQVTQMLYTSVCTTLEHYGPKLTQREGVQVPPDTGLCYTTLVHSLLTISVCCCCCPLLLIFMAACTIPVVAWLTIMVDARLIIPRPAAPALLRRSSICPSLSTNWRCISRRYRFLAPFSFIHCTRGQ